MARQDRIGSHATTIETNGPWLQRVTYHATAVVTLGPYGTITLDSGGWRTATTKTRMNQAAQQFGLPFSVSQRAGKWYVHLIECGEEVDFTDGMTISASGYSDTRNGGLSNARFSDTRNG
jgi:hypothetical protein